MKVKTIEIAWHRRPDANHNDPVFSVDWLNDTVFVTGGGDHEIKLWRLNTEQEDPTIEYIYSLKGHTQSVNVVRFSPNKKYLASAGDDGSMFIWGLNDKVCKNWWEISKDNCFWKKMIRGHALDVYDLSWCPNSQYIVTCGTDLYMIVWDINGTSYCRINEHTGYIQGIDWTKDDNYIISVANDRTARVYGYTKSSNFYLQSDHENESRVVKNDTRISKQIVNNKPLACKYVLKKSLFEGEEEGKGKEGEEEEKVTSREYLMYLGDTVPSFYRRPSSSNDGVFVVIPCGIYMKKEGEASRNCCYLYINGIFDRPYGCLPGFSYPLVNARFCDVHFRLTPDEEANSLVKLPYKHVFATTSTEEVFIYSTVSTKPLFYITNIHYAQICDFAWSSDGKYALTASSDGYCTLLSFEKNELGEAI